MFGGQPRGCACNPLSRCRSIVIRGEELAVHTGSYVTRLCRTGEVIISDGPAYSSTSLEKTSSRHAENVEEKAQSRGIFMTTTR